MQLLLHVPAVVCGQRLATAAHARAAHRRGVPRQPLGARRRAGVVPASVHLRLAVVVAELHAAVGAQRRERRRRALAAAEGARVRARHQRVQQRHVGVEVVVAGGRGGGWRRRRRLSTARLPASGDGRRWGTTAADASSGSTASSGRGLCRLLRRGGAGCDASGTDCAAATTAAAATAAGC